MESKPVYRIRKNGKQDVFEGTLDDVRKWLRQNSINSADEMRRSGYAVLELDEFWGLVSDFPELAMTERQGRGVLLAKMRKARRLMAFAVILAVASAGLFAYDRWLPELALSLDRGSYEQQLAEKDAALKQAIAAKAKECDATIDSIKSEAAKQLAEKESEINDLKSKAGQQKLSAASDILAKEKEIGRKSTEAIDQKRRAEDAEARAAESAQKVSSLSDENRTLKAQIAKLRDRKGKMPVVANLERKTFGGYRLNVWNFSTDEYPVQVVVKGRESGGKTYTKSIAVKPLAESQPGLGVLTDNIEAGDSVIIKPISEEGLDIIELSAPE